MWYFALSEVSATCSLRRMTKITHSRNKGASLRTGFSARANMRCRRASEQSPDRLGGTLFQSCTQNNIKMEKGTTSSTIKCAFFLWASWRRKWCNTKRYGGRHTRPGREAHSLRHRKHGHRYRPEERLPGVKGDVASLNFYRRPSISPILSNPNLFNFHCPNLFTFVEE